MQTRSPFASWYALATLSVVTLYALMDAQVLGLLAQSMKADLHLSDTQLGSLRGLGAVLFGAIAVLPLGWLADRIDRRLLLALCILVWSAAVASCGLATGYWSLLACMAFLSAGEAGLSPVVYSLIPELFPERQRLTANFVFYTATVLAGGAGLAIAGAVINHIDRVAPWFPIEPFARQTWRLVFFAVAVPGPLLALALGLVRLKRSGAQASPQGVSSRPQEQPQLWRYLASNWKSIFGVFGSVGLMLLGAGAVFTWLPIILTREFALSAGAVGVGLGTALAAGSVAGLVISAASAKTLTTKLGVATPLRLSQLGYLTLAVLTPFYYVAHSSTQIFLIAGLQMAAVTGSSALMPTVVQNLAPASLRGRVFAISTMSATLMQVISPIAVGLLSDHVFNRDGGLLLSSIVFGTPCLFAAAMTLRLTEKRILKTVEGVRALPDPT